MDPLDAAGGMGITGAVIAVAAAAREYFRRRRASSIRPPPVQIEPPRPQSSASSTQMRAVTDAMVQQSHNERLRSQVNDMHGVIMAKDDSLVHRVHNKPSIEAAILESRDLDREQLTESRRTNVLLEELVREIRGGRPRMPSTTDAK